MLAWNTFMSLVRNRFIFLFCALFSVVILLMIVPLFSGSPPSIELMLIRAIVTMLTGFGSMLAAWAAAEALAGEIKSGTILAVMARPVRRWEFLLGKYLGVQLLMLTYVLGMFATTWLLVYINNERFHSTWWATIVYPMVRYSIYSALSLLLVTKMHPVFAFCIVLITSVLANMVSPGTRTAEFLFPGWLRQGLYAVLPSAEFLTETRFLTISQTSLKDMIWTDHLLTLTYGINYAFVLFLLAIWSFRNRSLVAE
jgi:ABC-type transport system involved in multi-copper enzyme maturation permease subunit